MEWRGWSGYQLGDDAGWDDTGETDVGDMGDTDDGIDGIEEDGMETGGILGLALKDRSRGEIR
jgi:hypothetical protein